MAISKTALGAQVMKDRSINLSPQQRSALILCDGKRSAEDVVRMTAAVGVTAQDVDTLITMGLVASDSASSAPVAPNAASAAIQAGEVVNAMPNPAQPLDDTAQKEFSAALNAAITLCSDLGFKGFGLNMALTGVDSMEKLQQMAPEIRRAAGDAKYKSLHPMIFGKPL